MDVVAALRRLDGTQDGFLDGAVAGSVLAPGEADAAIGPRPHALGPAQADADVVAPAQPWRQPHHLFLVAAVAVEKDQQRIGVIGFVAGWQEGADRPAVDGL